MKDIIFVDGYNIIHDWKELKYLSRSVNLEAAREKLSDIVGEYASYTGINAIIVFDAHMVKGASDKQYDRPGVTIVYTKEHQTADSYIEKAVSQLNRYQQNIYVATSDGAEQMTVFSQGANRMSAREFLNEIIKKGTERSKKHNDSTSTQLGAYLDEDTKDKLKELLDF